MICPKQHMIHRESGPGYVEVWIECDGVEVSRMNWGKEPSMTDVINFVESVRFHHVEGNPEIDTFNKQLVGLRGEDVIVQAPQHRMTREEALVHAAWLVAVADRDEQFEHYLKAVTGT